MFPGFERFDQIFAEKEQQSKTPQYTQEHPLYTYGSGTTVVNGQTLYTAGSQPLPKDQQLYSY
jgi:hypothetical protein